MKILQKFAVGLAFLFIIAFFAMMAHEVFGFLKQKSAEKQVLVTENAQTELQSLNSETNMTTVTNVMDDGLTIIHDKGATFSMMVSTQSKNGTSSAPVVPPNPYLKK
jgi:hypothetical protein